MTIIEFQKKYPTKDKREAALQTMDNKEIDEIIKSCGTVQAKIYYSGFKKPEGEVDHQTAD